MTLNNDANSGVRHLRSISFLCITLTFVVPVRRANPQVQDVLLGCAEFILQHLLLALQHRHPGLQLLDRILHVPVFDRTGARTGLTKSHQLRGHSGVKQEDGRRI